MILTGKEIERQIKHGRINITPFDDANLQPNSYDLYLDVTRYKILDFITPDGIATYKNRECFLDAKIILAPNKLYLFSTIETTHTDHYAPMLEGVSSNARMGISVHETAGFGHIGFNGKWTLEVKVTVPTPVYHGMRIAQIYFHELSGEIELYKGRYQGQDKVEGAKV